MVGQTDIVGINGRVILPDGSCVLGRYTALVEQAGPSTQLSQGQERQSKGIRLPKQEASPEVYRKLP